MEKGAHQNHNAALHITKSNQISIRFYLFQFPIGTCENSITLDETVCKL